MDERIISYSQNKEDVILAGFFQDVKEGFYVDVGASHPVVSSVTKLFYENGWHGINIEPNKKQWKMLCADRPRDINLMVGVSDKKSTMKFREYEGYGLSTFSKEMMHEHSSQKDALTGKYKDYEVPVTTLREIFEENNVMKINFLKVDIEGLEYEALAGNDWKKYRPEVICIESNHIFKDWRPLLKKHSYDFAFNDGLNDYYVANESRKRMERFSYADSVLLGKPIIPLYWHQVLGMKEQKLFRREAELRHEKQASEELKLQVEHLQAELFLQRKTRNLVKRFIRNIDANIIGLINKLNEPKVKSASRGIELSGEDAQSIRINDLQNFYSNKSAAGYRKRYAYTILHSLYFSVRNVLKVLVQALLQFMRRLLKRGTA